MVYTFIFPITFIIFNKEEGSYNINFHYDKYYFFYSKLFNIKHIFWAL